MGRKQARAGDNTDLATGAMVPLVVGARELGFANYAAALNAVISGRLPAERLRGRWYIARRDLDRLVAERAEAE